MANLPGNDTDNTLIMTNGVDVVTAGLGNDTIKGAGFFTAQDQVDGGGDYDMLYLDGNYSVQTVFNATTIKNVENLVLKGGHDYSFKTHNANVAAGELLHVITNGGAGKLTFNGSAETDGGFGVEGMTGNDVLTGGAKGDAFYLEAGGNDTVVGGGGDDSVYFGNTLTSADKFNGGAGYDTVVLSGTYGQGLYLGPQTLVGIEELAFKEENNTSAQITADDAMVSAGATLKVRFFNGGGANQAFAFDGGAETNGHFLLVGGSGDDVMIGGELGDTFNLRWGGGDAVAGGKGDDEFSAEVNFDNNDFIDGGAGEDRFSIGFLDNNGITLSGANIKNVEIISFTPGQASRSVTSADDLVGAGKEVYVQGGYLGVGEQLVWDGSAEKDGTFRFGGGKGKDIFTGGALGDNFDLRDGGPDKANGGKGEDSFAMGASLTNLSRIDGGADSDSLALSGNYSETVLFESLTMRNVEYVSLDTGWDYSLKLHESTIAAGKTLTIGGHWLKASDWIKIDDRAETNDGKLLVSAGVTFLNAETSVRGGSGTQDQVDLNGDYSAGVTFGAETLTGVEELGLGSGFSYKLTTHDATVAAGAKLNVFALYLGAGHSLNFNGAAETNGSFYVSTGEGNDTVVTGAGDDTISSYYYGGKDSFSGGAGDDTFDVGANLNMNGDKIDGGAGHDKINFNGSATLTLGGPEIVDVEELYLNGGSFNLTAKDALLTAGETLTVNGYYLGAGEKLTFNGSLETNGAFDIDGGAANDVLTGGAGKDTLYGGAGIDALTGGAGDDTFYVDAMGDKVVEAAGGGSDTVYAKGSYLLGAGVSVEVLRTEAPGSADPQNLAGNELGQTIIGGVAANGLWGGGGNDTLTGGVGDDFFYFDKALSAAANLDTITDFANVAGNNDAIRLDDAVFSKLAGSSVLAAAAFKANTSGTATEADDRIIFETDTGKLFYDTNGSEAGGSTQFATLASFAGLTGAAALSAADFLIY